MMKSGKTNKQSSNKKLTYNNLTDNLIPIACDWKSSDWIIANTFLQKRLLENSNNPIQDARIHAMLSYRTPFSICDKFSEKNIKSVRPAYGLAPKNIKRII